jgi:F-type H+-transporting ATPase subunit b
MKSFRRFFLLLTGILATFFLMALPVVAAEGAEPDPADSLAGMIFRWVNFILVFGGIAYVLAKYGGAFFRGNAKEIAISITEATAAKAEADRELSEVETKISHLNQEVPEMREAARRNFAVEAERLRASGRAEIEKIKQAARVELEASERAAHHELRAAAASISVEHAGVLVSAKMNNEVRARLFRTFLDELRRSAN